MKRCLACVMIALLVFVAPAFPAGAAGFELPEGTQLTAQSVYIVNLDTGLCVYEKNADEKRSVASLTKLMTALLLIENVEDLEGTYISGGTALYTEEAGKLTEVPLVATVYTSATAEAVTEMRMLPVTVLPSEP